MGRRELGLVNSYTLEASFCGTNTLQFCSSDFDALGENFCRTLEEFLDPDSSAVTRAREALRELHPNKTRKGSTSSSADYLSSSSSASISSTVLGLDGHDRKPSRKGKKKKKKKLRRKLT